MIRINLLPPEYEIAQRKKEQQIIFGGVGGFLVLVLLLFWYTKNLQAANLDRKIQEANAELRSYETIIKEIEQIEADKKRKTEKLNVIKELNRSRLVYPVFFEDFTPIVPADIWLTKMDMKETGGSIQLSMGCKATSNFALATWLTNLEQSPHFSGISIGAISYTEEENRTVLTFELRGNYRHQGAFPLAEYY